MTAPTILVAEDDQRLLLALKVRLEALGFRIVTATDGERALELARQQPPDLLILDIHMPGCDGFSVIEIMDQIPELTATPVIYISGAVDEDLLNTQGERHGAIAAIHKPFEIEELIHNIELVLPSPAHAT